MRALHLAGLALVTGIALSACGSDSTTEPDPTPVRVNQVPTGWYAASATGTGFQAGVDSVQKHGGRAAAFLNVTVAPTVGSVVFYQWVRGDNYRGKRVRLTGWAYSTALIGDGGAFFMRVDGPVYLQSYDDMRHRRIMGTNGWKSYSIVLDVPGDALGFAFGVAVTGTGDLVFDDLRIEVVDQSVPSTAISIGGLSPTGGTAAVYAQAPLAPLNLDFEGGTGGQ